ncbi:MAG: M28 family peptidase [Candidatus Aminicenantes bacterium]|nr:M28 family peptidase [Candidatus Aminicenantes bacterium]
MIRLSPKYTQDLLARTRAMIDRCHPRLPGSPGCLRAAEEIRREMAKSCDRSHLEEFAQHPASFFLMNRVLAASYLLAGACFFLGGIATGAAAALFSLGTVYIINNFVFLGRFFDPLFPKKAGANAVGIMEPALEVRQQIILTGHHDSTPVCRFIEKRQWAYAFRMVLPIAFHLIANVGAFFLAAGIWSEPAAGGVRAFLKVAILAGGLFVVPMFWYYGRQASPGASDNLATCLALVKLAEIIRSGEAGRLNHTRLIFLSLDGEENGQRGSFAYAHRHRGELREMKSMVFNMDTLSRTRDLAFLKTDTNGLTRLSARLTGEGLRIAAELGRPVRAIRFPLGGGGTDAGQFARVGVESVSLIGISTHFVRRDVDYHTSRDTVDAIEPAAVEAGLEIALNFVLETDRTASEPS